ncbi:MAG: toll/interleukin-1 receptor domain-containing protein [Syntrophorhabdus aromaticivorans]|uniref:Toll/interleukin-1 receptor domain-containing protein n=1 Tax=Syntrophorhabdus aromaticivorans TaxID=328301 RepID=A0A971M6P0_9BACT|nr:toll/interleukin-1 receptor domain-containing protein [Syntrophorhabdus aromaticivorans]
MPAYNDANTGSATMEDCSLAYQYDAFVSYSSKDRPWVKDILLRRLEDNALRVCIDYRDFIPGLPSVENIQQAIRASRKILLVITPDYLKSSWTGFEAIRVQTTDPANERLRLLPLLRVKCEFYLGYTPLTYLNFADPEDEEL